LWTRVGGLCRDKRQRPFVLVQNMSSRFCKYSSDFIQRCVISNWINYQLLMPNPNWITLNLYH
jgi:hypothetical protein